MAPCGESVGDYAPYCMGSNRNPYNASLNPYSHLTWNGLEINIEVLSLHENFISALLSKHLRYNALAFALW